MKLIKKKIREVLKARINVSYRISTKEQDREVMNKKIFVEVLEQLRSIEDRKDFMLSEIGIDITAYEDMFFRVIENLFKLGVTSGSPPKAPTIFAGKLSQRIKMTLGLEVFKIESVFAVKS